MKRTTLLLLSAFVLFALSSCSKKSQPPPTAAASPAQTAQPAPTPSAPKPPEPISSPAANDKLLDVVAEALHDEQVNFCSQGNLSGDECETQFRSALTLQQVKLTPDGQENGVLVTTEGFYFCGSGGCSAYLLKCAAKCEVLINGFNLEMATTVTAGHYDVSAAEDMHDPNSAQAYKWSGKEYVLAKRAGKQKH